MASKLDALIAEAVGLTRELENLNADRKLSFKAFFAEALHIADCDEKRLAEVKKIVYERHGTEHLQAFVRRYSKALSEPNFPRPLEDPSRATRIYGSDELLPQAAQHQILAGELQALAVKVCQDRFPASFGPVVDRAEHEKKTTGSRQRLGILYNEMQEAYSGVDLITSQQGLFQEEIARGLCRVTFKQAPAIGPHHGDWPRELVAAAATPAKSPKRERLAGTRAA